MKVFNYIIAQNFFRDYCPEVVNYKHKARGKNGRGNPVDFTESDKAAIKKALKKLFKDLEGSL